MAFNARKIIAATLMLFSASTVLPQASYALDDKQKQEIGDFIKEYLVANPEILLEAQKALKSTNNY